MIRSIVVPLDGFAFGEHALPMALSIARRAKSPVKLVHVLQPFVEVVPELAAYQGSMEVEYRQEKQKYLDSLVRRLREMSDVPVTSELLEGDIIPAIRSATEGKADLVVMTTHGRGPVARFWLGSVADQLVRELRVPLLLMHPPKEKPDFHEEPSFRHVLVPLDGSPLAEQIIPTTVELAKLMGSEMTLFRAVRTELPLDFDYRFAGTFVPARARGMADELKALQERQRKEAEDYLRGIADRVRSMGVPATVKAVVEETPAMAILHETTRGTDLVALATHGYGGLKRLWRGSVADKVIRGAAIPVLVQRPQM